MILRFEHEEFREFAWRFPYFTHCDLLSFILIVALACKRNKPLRTPVLEAFRVPGGATRKTWWYKLDEFIASRTLFPGLGERVLGERPQQHAFGEHSIFFSDPSCSVHLGSRGEMCCFAMTFHLATGPLSDHAPPNLCDHSQSYPSLFKLTFSGFCHGGGRLTKLSSVVFLIWSDTSYCFYFPTFHLLACQSFIGKTWNKSAWCLWWEFWVLLHIELHTISQEVVKLRRKPE